MKTSEIKINDNHGIIAEQIDKVIYNSSSIKTSVMAQIINNLILSKKASRVEKKVNYRQYKIEDKIKYNNLDRYKKIIDKYCEYSTICEKTINKMDDVNPGIKEEFMEYINSIYLVNIINKEDGGIDGDKILDVLISTFSNMLDKCDEIKNICYEQRINNLYAILVYCFIECQILERPPEK